MKYAPMDHGIRDYALQRYGLIMMTQMDVLDKALEGKTWLVNDEYTIADMCCYPWFELLRSGYFNVTTPEGKKINAMEFINPGRWKNLSAWADRIKARPAVQRGIKINAKFGVHHIWSERKFDV